MSLENVQNGDAPPKQQNAHRAGHPHPAALGIDEQQQEQAAQVIQRNYRGYRTRRQLNGMGLDASMRWAEAVKQARWQNATRPVPRAQRSPRTDDMSPTDSARSRAASEAARQNWKRVGEIARRAGGDDPSEPSQDEDAMTPEERAAYKRKKARLRDEREKTAKMMDLQYFLEMVDVKHRYGSNLRAYHDSWKREDTHENFFYWLDEGEGKDFEHPTVSRERLEREQVRYLSREERMKYLVKVDGEGRLCWAKNGERIWTTPDYKDSLEGIVPRDDKTPAYAPGGTLDGADSSRRSSSESSSESSTSSEHSDVEGEHYVNEDLKQAKGLSKIKHVSAATVLNHLLRGSVKPNSWIFVADTSFRLYIGIKQSGAFQHSSFLHGARISAAGLIKIKDGQLRRLSPLSGHYRPPTKNFRAFVHALQAHGVDMSRVSISRSYAVLVGLEAYVKTRRKVKHGIQHVEDAETRILKPEEYARRKEEEKDKSESAQKERRLLAAQEERVERERRERSWAYRVWRRLRREGEGKEERRKEADERRVEKRRSRKGQDVEDGIAPAGERDRIRA